MTDDQLPVKLSANPDLPRLVKRLSQQKLPGGGHSDWGHPGVRARTSSGLGASVSMLADKGGAIGAL